MCRSDWLHLSKQHDIDGSTASAHNTLDWAWYDWLHQPTLWVHGYDTMRAEDFVRGLESMAAEPIVFLPMLYELEGEVTEGAQEQVARANALLDTHCQAPWPKLDAL